MDNRYISELLDRYLRGETNPEETRELLKLFESNPARNYLYELVDKKFDEGVEANADILARLNPLTDRVEKKLNLLIRKDNQFRPIRRLRLGVVAAAASIIVALGGVLIYHYGKEKISSGSSIAVIDVDPGGNRAKLILSDGREINLENAATGTLANESGAIATKNSEGVISYSMAESSASASTFNTIQTPNGGTYQVRLPDGTKVWLNATSSLKYPVSFSGRKERMVELIGEAYFEVSHNARQPFLVSTSTQTVEVLGTHFNINSYADEGRIITTLEEGSVKIASSANSKIIKPGEQSVNEGGKLQVQAANMETALAWKNGNIIFKSATINEIMRQVKRWYNIEVIYEGKANPNLFSGGISRNSKLSVLLNVLKDNGINFELKENANNKTLVIKQ
ncbi:FecR family protein [Pedobacter insulae]|uniref:FecR protein n=1 Tax=Pedobacter insulae TaxID=414048 RepID=A0A1I2ZIH2_9SPHI|nr:FecR family protein [Pedobacter insulae]SFH37613.1 protein of unknown function [Pedobacter insulae]